MFCYQPKSVEIQEKNHWLSDTTEDYYYKFTKKSAQARSILCLNMYHIVGTNIE